MRLMAQLQLWWLCAAAVCAHIAAADPTSCPTPVNNAAYKFRDRMEATAAVHCHLFGEDERYTTWAKTSVSPSLRSADGSTIPVMVEIQVSVEKVKIKNDFSKMSDHFFRASRHMSGRRECPAIHRGAATFQKLRALAHRMDSD